MSRLCFSPRLLRCLSLCAAAAAAAPAPGQGVLRGGDLRRLEWVRPLSAALQAASKSGRLLLVKPILGGSNTPDPGGLPCGGKKDCDGSW